MSALTSPLRTGRLARVNPLAKLAAALVPGLTLILSVDWVSALTAIVAETLLLAWARPALRPLLLRISPVLAAAPLVAASTVLYGDGWGEVYFGWGLMEVSQGSIQLGAAIGLRVLAVGVPAVALFATIDPTDLSDALAQLLHLPARFVLGGLAGLRLLGLLMDDWRSLTLARRARGIGDRGRVRRTLTQAFGLLVLSIRRGTRLATAMEARGFGGPARRTWARRSVFRRRDWAVTAAGVAIAAAAVGVAVLTGSWNFVFS